MPLSKEDIKEFQDIYYEEFGEKLPYDDAEMMAGDLLSLFYMLVQEKPDQNNFPPRNQKTE